MGRNNRTKHPRQKSRLDIARAVARNAHRGEGLKFSRRPYISHVFSVARRVHGDDEKIFALLHDVVESHIKNSLGKNPDPIAEADAIREKLEEIQLVFQSGSRDIDHLLPHVNALTRRVHEKEDGDELANNRAYSTYIARLIKHGRDSGSLIVPKVKLADLEDNSRPDRNPKLSANAVRTLGRIIQDEIEGNALSPTTAAQYIMNLSDEWKHVMRLARYALAIRAIYDAFPADKHPGLKLTAHKPPQISRGVPEQNRKGPRRPGAIRADEKKLAQLHGEPATN